MHPAPSIIVFTVLSGLGLGMLFCIGLGLGEGHLFGWIAVPLALAVTAAGGAASTLHLARPSRAWRAFSQWRSSWLSREACLMIATIAAVLLYAALWLLADLRLALLGWLAAALAAGTVYATAMIYAQLATVPRWSMAPTRGLFLAVALLGGLLGTELAARLAGGSAISAWWLLAAFIATAMIYVRWQTAAAGANRRAAGSDMGTATGLGRMGRVSAFEAPHTGSNYLLDEMAYRVGRKRAWQLRSLGAGLGFGLPLLLTVLAAVLPVGSVLLLLLALLAHAVGMMALRWLFFAEAEHVQALYYGMR
ncbi:MAG: DmsC/YnfH family molybdoenzyme membrane anchor subunit [Pseudomonadota bacterium]